VKTNKTKMVLGTNDIKANIETYEKLDEKNRGYKLMRTMGWNENKGLGKRNQGIISPIK
jgi:hypothetical protein